MGRVSVVASVSAGLVSLAVACGTSPPDRLTHAELVRRVNAQCLDTYRALRAVALPSRGELVAQRLADVSRVFTHEYDALTKLKPLPEDRKLFDAYRKRLAVLIDLADRMVISQRNPHPGFLLINRETPKTLAALHVAARRLGAQECTDAQALKRQQFVVVI